MRRMDIIIGRKVLALSEVWICLKELKYRRIFPREEGKKKNCGLQIDVDIQSANFQPDYSQVSPWGDVES